MTVHNISVVFGKRISYLALRRQILEENIELVDGSGRIHDQDRPVGEVEKILKDQEHDEYWNFYTDFIDLDKKKAEICFTKSRKAKFAKFTLHILRHDQIAYNEKDEFSNLVIGYKISTLKRSYDQHRKESAFFPSEIGKPFSYEKVQKALEIFEGPDDYFIVQDDCDCCS